MEVCTRGPTSLYDPLKKDPEQSRALPEATKNVAEDEDQSDWSLEECQELLGEAMAERTGFHGSNEEGEEPMQERLSKLPPDAAENLAKEPATVKSCSIVTASRELLIKEDSATEATAEKPRF